MARLRAATIAAATGAASASKFAAAQSRPRGGSGSSDCIAKDDAALAAAAAKVASARRVVAFTGAGTSAESGVSTYRDAVSGEGVWDGALGRLELLIFGTSFGFRCLPDAAWRHYCERLLLPISTAEPNPGHTAIAELCETVITQNVDGLHQRAGSAEVIELHGTVTSHRHAWLGTPIAVDTARLDAHAPPARFVRPDVILFGEGMTAAFWDAADCVEHLGPGDVLLVVGTSLAVAPANTLPYAAASRGCHVVEVNLERCMGDSLPVVPVGDELAARPIVDFGAVTEIEELQSFLPGAAGTVLPALAARVRALRGERRPGGFG